MNARLAAWLAALVGLYLAACPGRVAACVDDADCGDRVCLDGAAQGARGGAGGAADRAGAPGDVQDVLGGGAGGGGGGGGRIEVCVYGQACVRY